MAVEDEVDEVDVALAEVEEGAEEVPVWNLIEKYKSNPVFSVSFLLYLFNSFFLLTHFQII